MKTMKEVVDRPEFLTPASPLGLRAVQVTSDAERDSEAVYCDCPSWSPDSRFFAFCRGASADGRKARGLWLCDTQSDFSIEPLVEFPDGKGNACLSPDGACAYSVRQAGDQIEVRRIELGGGGDSVVVTAPMPLRLHGNPILTMSADSERLLAGAFLGDGKTEGAPWGAYVFDVRRGGYHIVEFGNGYCNMHCQYSHNPDPEYSHDILLNAYPERTADGSWLTPPDGSWPKSFPNTRDNMGGAYTVVRDDGSNWRMVPIARHPQVIIGGHNVWRGREYAIVGAAYDARTIWRSPLFEAVPMPIASAEDALLGMRRPGAKVVDLTRCLPKPDSCHFAFDASGRHFVSDTDGYTVGAYSFVFIGTYVEAPDSEPFVSTRYLLLPRTSWKGQPAHPHPYLSPDGRFVVFQSDFAGRPQVNVAYGFEYP